MSQIPKRKRTIVTIGDERALVDHKRHEENRSGRQQRRRRRARVHVSSRQARRLCGATTASTVVAAAIITIYLRVVVLQVAAAAHVRSYFRRRVIQRVLDRLGAEDFHVAEFGANGEQPLHAIVRNRARPIGKSEP